VELDRRPRHLGRARRATARLHRAAGAHAAPRGRLPGTEAHRVRRALRGGHLSRPVLPLHRAAAVRGAHLLHALLLHDRPARDPRPRRHGRPPLGAAPRLGAPLDPREQPRHRARRHVLAPGRPDLDLPLAAALPGGLMSDEHTKASTYIWTWVALVVLAVLTFILSRLDLGAFQVPVALVIAVGKGLFVVMVFMHLLEHGATSRIFFGIAFTFIVLLVTLSTADIVTRDDVPARPPPTRS